LDAELIREFSFCFLDEDQLKEPVERINVLVDQIDKEDPWVLQQFSIKGPGEGLVWYPTSLADPKTKYLPINLFEAYPMKCIDRWQNDVIFLILT
jgi:hypothetical protein